MFAVLLLLKSNALAAVMIPPHTPSVWGGMAQGTTGIAAQNGHLFAFSGADGPTSEGSGFCGVLTKERYGVTWQHRPGNAGIAIDATLSTPGSAGGTLVAASSDAYVVDKKSGGGAEIVVAHTAWNTLVGYAPAATLTTGEEQTAAGQCNLSGRWVQGPTPHGGEYIITQAADGEFSALTSGHTWRSASGNVTGEWCWCCWCCCWCCWCWCCW